MDNNNNAEKAIKVLKNIKRQIEVDLRYIPTNDRGNGSSGVGLLQDTFAIDLYIKVAKSGCESDLLPGISRIEYISEDDFTDYEDEICCEIVSSFFFVDKNDILGLIAIHSDEAGFTLYIAHII